MSQLTRTHILTRAYWGASADALTHTCGLPPDDGSARRTDMCGYDMELMHADTVIVSQGFHLHPPYSPTLQSVNQSQQTINNHKSNEIRIVLMGKLFRRSFLVFLLHFIKKNVVEMWGCSDCLWGIHQNQDIHHWQVMAESKATAASHSLKMHWC